MPDVARSTGLEAIYLPDARARRESNLGRYMDWLAADRHLYFDDYGALWRWSVEDLEGFWQSLWEYFELESEIQPTAVLTSRDMPGARWFPGARINYAEHLLRNARSNDRTAIIAESQTRSLIRMTYGELWERVSQARTGLQRLGVGSGDRVVAYLPNIPETLISFLASASLGAIFASCAPEFGAPSVIERFAQIEPTVLLTVSGYRYGTKEIHRTDAVEQIVAALPGLRAVVHVPYFGELTVDHIEWDQLLASAGPAPELDFEAVDFAHPLFVLFSSGTTGKPKAIVHGHGGILIEHLKNHTLSFDVGPEDTFMWFCTTAWMMWNQLVSVLLTGAAAVMIDGNPMYPSPSAQWEIAARTGTTILGVSPGLVMQSRAADVHPAREHDLSTLRELAVAGSPLAAEGYEWVLEEFGPGVRLNVGTGGTDVCTGLIQGSPLQPVWVGEISGPCLGVAATAFNEVGEIVVGERGELVITEPMPSMPVGFWADPEGERYRSTYFDMYPGVWRHGDWVRFSVEGSCVVIGRSDATLNRGGVRLGTAEFYQVLEEHPDVVESLVIHLEDSSGGIGELLLFLALGEGRSLTDGLRAELVDMLRTSLSPRHVPDEVYTVSAIPKNRTGKRLEVPVKRILQGHPVASVVSTDILAEVDMLDPFIELASRRRPGQ